MGTTDGTSHDWVFGRRIFKGRRGRTGRRTNGGALPGPRASRRLDRFQARAENPPSTRDDNSCRGPRRRLRRPLGRRRLYTMAR